MEKLEKAIADFGAAIVAIAAEHPDEPCLSYLAEVYGDNEYLYDEIVEVLKSAACADELDFNVVNSFIKGAETSRQAGN